MSLPGLYVHLPAHVRDLARHGDGDAYLRCLDKEAALLDLPSALAFETLYIGGCGEGVLSSFSPLKIRGLLEMIKRRFRWDRCSQATVELHCSDTTPEQLLVLRDCGVHRVTALAPVLTETVGMDHVKRSMARFILLARRSGIAWVDLDLVWTPRSLRTGTARELLSFVLRLKPDTVHMQRREDDSPIPLPEEEQRSMLGECLDMIAAAGPGSAEADNLHLAHAKVFHGSVLGLGFEAVSHARFAMRYMKNGSFRDYLGALQSGLGPPMIGVPMGPSEEMRAFVIRGIENQGQVSRENFRRLFGVAVESAFPEEYRLARGLGAVDIRSESLFVPASFGDGREVAAKFFYESKYREIFRCSIA